MTSDIDETRRYVDASGVVHRSSDHGDRTRITCCERYWKRDEFPSSMLLQTSPTRPITCILCLART